MAKLSPKMVEWLTLLRDEGPQPSPSKGRGHIPHDARMRDFSEWDYRINAKPATPDEMRATYGELWWDHVDWKAIGERISEAGRKALAETAA